MSKIRRSGPALQSNSFLHLDPGPLCPSAPYSAVLTFHRFQFAGFCTILRPLFFSARCFDFSIFRRFLPGPNSICAI